MVSTSPKIDQILVLVKELSQSERVGLMQRIAQMFLPNAESASAETNAPAGTNSQDVAQESPYFAVHPQRHLMLQEQEAFDAMIDELRANYLGQYVAVYQGKVIDHDADEGTLVERTQEKYPDQTVLIRQVLSTAEKPLVWRSVRFIENT